MTKHLDPVCGMVVREDAGKPTYEYNNKKYYFCSEHCRDAFAGDPEKYLAMKPEERSMEKGHHCCG